MVYRSLDEPTSPQPPHMSVRRHHTTTAAKREVVDIGNDIDNLRVVITTSTPLNQLGTRDSPKSTFIRRYRSWLLCANVGSNEATLSEVLSQLSAARPPMTSLPNDASLQHLKVDVEEDSQLRNIQSTNRPPFTGITSVYRWIN